MKNRKWMSAALCSVLSLSALTGCSSSAPADDKDSQDGKDSTQTEAGPEKLLNEIKDASDDDKALEAWKTLLLTSASASNYQFGLETDGEDYVYEQDDPEGNVSHNDVYEIGREGWFDSSSEEKSYALNLTAVDGSDDNYLEGYATIDRIGKDGILLSVSLSNPDLEHLAGKIDKVSDNGGDMSMITRDDSALNLMMDTMVNNGYNVSIDPFHNASLYSYEVSQDGNSWVLKADVRDLEGYKQAASNKALLYENRNGRPALDVSQIEKESWEFRFDQNGVLDEVTSTLVHVLFTPKSQSDDQVYLSILNRTEFKKGIDDDLNMQKVSELCTQAKDGTLSAGSEFSLEKE